MPDSAVIDSPPQAAPPDWQLIRELYNQGVQLKDIEAQTGVKVGTIAARASRARWRDVATKARLIAQSTSPDPQLDSPALVKLNSTSEAVRAALAGDLKRICELLQDRPANTLKSGLKRQRDLVPLVQNAKTVFGWSEGTSEPLVRINVLGNCTVNADSPLPSPSPLNESPAIDVSPVPLNAPDDSLNSQPSTLNSELSTPSTLPSLNEPPVIDVTPTSPNAPDAVSTLNPPEDSIPPPPAGN